MTAGQRVSGVDVSVAGGAERSRVRLADESCGSALARLAHPDPVVLRRHPVGGVYAGVAAGAEVSRVGFAVDSACRRPTRVADTSPSADIRVTTVALQHLWEHRFDLSLRYKVNGGGESGEEVVTVVCSRKRHRGLRIQGVTRVTKLVAQKSCGYLRFRVGPIPRDTEGSPSPLFAFGIAHVFLVSTYHLSLTLPRVRNTSVLSICWAKHTVNHYLLFTIHYQSLVNAKCSRPDRGTT